MPGEALSRDGTRARVVAVSAGRAEGEGGHRELFGVDVLAKGATDEDVGLSHAQTADAEFDGAAGGARQGDSSLGEATEQGRPEWPGDGTDRRPLHVLAQMQVLPRPP